jgi:cell division septation protein DedD
MVFGSGFLLGLAWYEPLPVQTALQHHRHLVSARQALSDLAKQPMSSFEPTSHATLEADTATGVNPPLNGSNPSPSSSHTQSPQTTELSPHQPAPTSDAVHPEVEPQPDSPKLSTQDRHPRPYLVQVGVFQNESNAQNMVEKLRDKGYQPFIRIVEGQQHRVLHRVYIDRIQDKEQAKATAKAFEETEKMEAIVMLANDLTDSSKTVPR